MKSRGERLLNALEAKDASILPEPITREDMYMNALVTKETDGLPVPVTIEEHYLHAGATNADVSTLRTPITREDVYLRGFSTKDVDALPEPITLEERFIRAAIAFLGASAEQPEEPVDPPVDPPVEPPADGRSQFAVMSNYLNVSVHLLSQMNADTFIDETHADKSEFLIAGEPNVDYYIFTTEGTYITFENGLFSSDGNIWTLGADNVPVWRSKTVNWSAYPVKLYERYNRTTGIHTKYQ